MASSFADKTIASKPFWMEITAKNRTASTFDKPTVVTAARTAVSTLDPSLSFPELQFTFASPEFKDDVLAWSALPGGFSLRDHIE